MKKSLSPGLTQKILFIITVPLLIEMALFGALAVALTNAESDLARESAAVKVLTYVNTLIFDVVSASASVLIYDNLRDQSVKSEFEYSFGALKENTAQLEKLAPETGQTSKEIGAFIGIIDDISKSMTSIAGYDSGSFGFENMLFTEKLKSTLRVRAKITSHFHRGRSV